MITVPAFIAELTADAYARLLRAARAVPSERAQWTVNEHGRSTLDQVQEVAVITRSFPAIVRAASFASFDRSAFDAAKTEMPTLEAAIAAVDAALPELLDVIRGYPVDQLEDPIMLPFRGGTPSTMARLLAMPAWNTTYHDGQVNFIQRLYGDLEMH